MTEPRRHPRHALNPILHSPVRLSIVALLASAGEADFQFLSHTVEASDSLLSKNISLLEQAGYLRVIKGQVSKRPTTWCSLTEAGRLEFLRYRTAVQEILMDPEVVPPPHRSEAPLVKGATEA